MRFLLPLLLLFSAGCSKKELPKIDKRVCFIVNPISGIGKQREFEKRLEGKPYEYDVRYSARPGHETELSRKALQEGYDVIVAVGGDGTVNHVAKALIGTDATLGIIPTGSGNGFARHLKISRNPRKALATIDKMRVKRVDTMRINDETYLSMAGIGFDANVSIAFSNQSRRGLASYLKVVLQELRDYEPQHYELIVDGKTINTHAFLITFANAAQYGNNIYIAPQAKIDDGYLDLCILKQFPPQAAPKIIHELLTKRINESEYVEAHRCQEVVIHAPKLQCHIDGDPRCFTDEVKITVLPSSLKVLR